MLVLTGSNGLFTRLGHLIYSITNTANVYRGTSLPARVALIEADYSTTDQVLMDGIFAQLTSAQNAPRSFASYCQTLARNTVTQMVNEFQPQIDQSFQQALLFLVNHLNANSQTVLRNTVSSTVTPGGSNHGDGVLRVSMNNNTGTPCEQAFVETLSGFVSRDSQSGATAGLESLSLTGQFAISDMLSWQWPAGSGTNTSLTAVSSATSNGNANRNWLVNGNMELFGTGAGANTPTGWHIGVGTDGTSILKSTDAYDGTHSLSFVGDSAENTTLQTRLGADVTALPTGSDQLAVNLWTKLDITASSGVLTIELVDGSGTPLLDVLGNSSSITVAINTLTTSWAPIGGFLRTPLVLPAQVWLRLRLSTALPTGHTLLMDRVSLTRPSLWYPGGPSASLFSGAINFAIGDTFSIAISNAHNGLMQSGCDRLLGLRSSGFIFPSTTGTPTILDSLVS